MAALRVLFLNDLHDPRTGSSIRQMYQHAARLRELGHQTAVISTTPDRASVGPTTIEGCHVERLFSRYPPRFRPWIALNHRSVVRELVPLLRAWRPDVVHSHIVHSHLSYEALRAARRAGAGVVFTAHDSMTFCYQKLDCFHGGEEQRWAARDYRARATKCIPCQRLRFRPGRNAAIRAALAEAVDRFTTVTDELGAAIRANGIRVDRTIHNALEVRARAEDEAALERFRRSTGLAGKRVIAIGGRLHALKGVKQVFHMLAALRGEFPDLRLLVLGREEVYEGFRPWAVAAGVDDLVVTPGWLDGDELVAALRAVDVMLTPSICFETFGMMNLEAAEFSKPVVATCFGGCLEVVRDGENGFVANPFDIQAFAGRIGELLRDPALRRRMGEAGRKRLVEHFSIERLTREFLEEYEFAAAAARKRVGAGLGSAD